MVQPSPSADIWMETGNWPHLGRQFSRKKKKKRKHFLILPSKGFQVGIEIINGAFRKSNELFQELTLPFIFFLAEHYFFCLMSLIFLSVFLCRPWFLEFQSFEVVFPLQALQYMSTSFSNCNTPCQTWNPIWRVPGHVWEKGPIHICDITYRYEWNMLGYFLLRGAAHTDSVPIDSHSVHSTNTLHLFQFLPHPLI